MLHNPDPLVITNNEVPPMLAHAPRPLNVIAPFPLPPVVVTMKCVPYSAVAGAMTVKSSWTVGTAATATTGEVAGA
jgi:hypothetical protein